ncbi:Protein phosphatase 2C 2 [Gonapodya sp. JEL0774]|nr:Protein phosphatase 2C 2 [Gonapodya sp. JEL0774]
MPNIAFPHHCPHPFVCTYSNFPVEAAPLINEYLEASNVDVADSDSSPVSPTFGGPRKNGLNGFGKPNHSNALPPSGEDDPDNQPDFSDSNAELEAKPIPMARTPTGHITINSTLDLDLGSGSDSTNGPMPPHAPITRVVSTYTATPRAIASAVEANGTHSPSSATSPTNGGTTKPNITRSDTQITIPTHPSDVPQLKNVHPPPYIFRSLLFPSEEHHSFFAVCDGHRGNRVAHYLSRRIHWRISSSDEFERGEYADAMRKGFVGLDEELKAAYDTVLTGREPAGSTCVTALVTTDQQLYVANAGDSRAVLCCAGEVVPMSYDHKPDGESERQRIEDAGGRLATARALGDFDFKKDTDRRLEDQMVTGKPDVFHKTLTDDDEFLVMCSDGASEHFLSSSVESTLISSSLLVAMISLGVFDVLTSASLVSFIRSRLAAGITPPNIAGEVLDYCLATNPSIGDIQAGAAAGTDNMTCLIVVFLRGRSWDEYVEVVRRRYGGVASPDPEDEVVEVDLANLDENGEPKRRPREGSTGSSVKPPPIVNPKRRYNSPEGAVEGWVCCGMGPGTESKGGPEAGSTRVTATKVEPIARDVEEVEMVLRRDAPAT